MEWREIAGYEGLYLISSNGEVLSKKRNTLMKARLDRDGYLVVGLSKDNKQVTHKIHRLVAESFLDKIENTEVDHINGIKTDNKVENLQWISQKENLEKRNLDSLKIKVVKIEKITNIILEEFSSIREASRQTGIPHSNISNCINGNRKSAGGFIWKILN